MFAGATLTGLILLQWATWGFSTASNICEDVTTEAPVIGSNLLQIQVSKGDDHFGPGNCISLFRSSVGTCIMRTDCGITHNISDVEFAFVCSNPQNAMPHALHSFGRGGFEPHEMFDTGVKCQTCQSVQTAYRKGSPLMRNALAALPQGRLAARSTPGAHLPGAAGPPVDIERFEPEESVTHFGPSACVSTFQAPTGTCLIRTRCKGVDLSGFNIGITCLDMSGGYTRYLFGKDAFQSTETFDTQMQCFKCLGVGAESSTFAVHSALPKQLMEDVGSLKTDVETLEERVRVLTDSKPIKPVDPPPPSNGFKASTGKKATDRPEVGSSKQSGAQSHSGSKLSHETFGYEDIEENGIQIPTIMVERVPGAMAGTDQLQQGPSPAMLVVKHQRAPVITELLRRIQRSNAQSWTGHED